MAFNPLKRQARLAASISAVLAIVIVYALAGEIYNYRDSATSENLPEVDAIVCLGGGRGRIAAAGDLWFQYWEAFHKPRSPIKSVPILYFSGMGSQSNWVLLSRRLHPAVLQKIRPEWVVLEKESSNTDENARWLVKYAQQLKWSKVLLVTSSYHMKRAKFIFEEVLKKAPIPLQLETLSISQDPFTSKEWRSGPNAIRVTLLEYVKWIYYYSFWKPATT